MSSSLTQRLFFVTGKGGVGKSTVASALALAFSQRGERTLLCELNANDRVAQLLERPPPGPDIQQLEPNLWAVDIRPAEAMREYALMILKFSAVYRTVFENRLVRHFLRLIPSLQELVMIGKIFFHLRETLPGGEPRFSRIVVDAPATGHALSFLRLPQVLLETVPPGPLAKEAEVMRKLLVDPAVSASVLVTLPEELPLQETFELAQSLEERVGLHHALTVLNSFTAPRFDDADQTQIAGNPLLEPVMGHHQQRVAQSQEALNRLRGLRAPVALVPLFFFGKFGREAVEQTARALRPWVEPSGRLESASSGGAL